MLTFMQIYAVEILSVTMGLWLLWIVIIYFNYFKELRSPKHPRSIESNKEDALQKARALRKKTYNLAVTYPSYIIFWIVVGVWGVSYLLKTAIH